MNQEDYLNTTKQQETEAEKVKKNMCMIHIQN